MMMRFHAKVECVAVCGLRGGGIMKELFGPRHYRYQTIDIDVELWEYILKNLRVYCGPIHESTSGLFVTKWPDVDCPHIHIASYIGNNAETIIKVWPVIPTLDINDKIDIKNSAPYFYGPLPANCERNFWYDAVISTEYEGYLVKAKMIGRFYEDKASIQGNRVEVIVLKNYK